MENKTERKFMSTPETWLWHGWQLAGWVVKNRRLAQIGEETREKQKEQVARKSSTEDLIG